LPCRFPILKRFFLKITSCPFFLSKKKTRKEKDKKGKRQERVICLKSGKRQEGKKTRKCHLGSIYGLLSFLLMEPEPSFKRLRTTSFQKDNVVELFDSNPGYSPVFPSSPLPKIYIPKGATLYHLVWNSDGTESFTDFVDEREVFEKFNTLDRHTIEHDALDDSVDYLRGKNREAILIVKERPWDVEGDIEVHAPSSPSLTLQLSHNSLQLPSHLPSSTTSHQLIDVDAPSIPSSPLQLSHNSLQLPSHLPSSTTSHQLIDIDAPSSPSLPLQLSHNFLQLPSQLPSSTLSTLLQPQDIVASTLTRPPARSSHPFSSSIHTLPSTAKEVHTHLTQMKEKTKLDTKISIWVSFQHYYYKGMRDPVDTFLGQVNAKDDEDWQKQVFAKMSRFLKGKVLRKEDKIPVVEFLGANIPTYEQYQAHFRIQHSNRVRTLDECSSDFLISQTKETTKMKPLKLSVYDYGYWPRLDYNEIINKTKSVQKDKAGFFFSLFSLFFLYSDTFYRICSSHSQIEVGG
jgi:hypothetical protein